MVNNEHPDPTQHCTLQNGRKVSVTTSIGQAFAYGAGGGDPSAAFTLRIDDTILYYAQQFYTGYSAGAYTLSKVSYHHGELKECDASEHPKCTLQPERLDGKGLSDAEQGAMKADTLRVEIAKDNLPICQKILGPASWAEDSTALKEIDLDNNGIPDIVLGVSGSNHYFDGSYLIAFYNGEGDPDYTKQYIEENKDTLNIEDPKDVAKIEKWGGHFISISPAGSSPRYVHNVAILYKNKSYIYAFESNIERIPARTISRVLPDHTVQTICKFNN